MDAELTSVILIINLLLKPTFTDRLIYDALLSLKKN